MTDPELRRLGRALPDSGLDGARRLAHAKLRAGGPDYECVGFEPRAPRDTNGSQKQLFTYDQSLTSLRNRRHDRHPRPAEAFGLLIANLEGTLYNTPLKTIADDMLNTYGEWLSMAWERQSDTLLAHTDPEGLTWNPFTHAYVRNNFTCTETHTFTITRKPSTTRIDLQEFNEHFTTLHYGKPFNKLPKPLREGPQKAQVLLPPDGTVWPVGRGSFNDLYGINGHNAYLRASRGAVTPQKNFHKK